MTNRDRCTYAADQRPRQLAYFDRTEGSIDAWWASKSTYLAHMMTKLPSTLRVSLADTTHYARAISADLEVNGQAVWTRFKSGREDPSGIIEPLLKHSATACRNPPRSDLRSYLTSWHNDGRTTNAHALQNLGRTRLSQ